jgi:squalene-hopene/tetraprenyl-beta-curcumene cyclase
VPDADDTPGALLALTALDESRPFQNLSRVADALLWLVRLQNNDGGWPTFCRGWGKLPFDRSGSDLTAHALRALEVHRLVCPSLAEAAEKGLRIRFVGPSREVVSASLDRGLRFLSHRQHPDGSWSPLWFGNQDHPDEDNPVYGTAKVLMAYRDLGLMDTPEALRGIAWLVANQNEDGGWGSGVWHGIQNAEFRMQSDDPRGNEAADGVISCGGEHGPRHLVLGTQYSVLSTQYFTSAPSSRPLNPEP